MKFIFHTISLICLLFLVACGSKEATQTVSSAKEELQVAKETATTAVEQVKETSTTLAQTASNTVKSEIANKQPTIVAEQATTIKKEAQTNIPKKESTTAANKIAIKEAKSPRKKVVEQATTSTKEKIADTKEAIKAATTPIKEKAKIKIEGATAVATTATTTIKNTKPKVVEAATEKVAETAAKAPAKKEVVNLNAAVNHSAWDQLLRKQVSSTGKVNYKGIKANKAALDGYLKALDVPFKDSWSRSEKMAYWINAYNAFTVKLIVDNYPVKSITDLHGGKPWDRSWIKLGGKTYSLNDIEHKILRPQFKDARIHFAVNCAASSCPPLLNQAWTAKNLNSNLERQARQFINNSKYNSVASDKLAISKIFEWYQEDFGDLVTYLNKYAGTTIQAGTKVEFKEYDWALNE